MHDTEIYAVARDIDKQITGISPAHPSKSHLDAWAELELSNSAEATSALGHAQAALQSCSATDAASQVAGTLAMAAWLVTNGAIQNEGESRAMFLEAAKQSIESITTTRYGW